MKLFHLSDLHIGLKLYDRDLRQDQEHILGLIVKAAAEQRPDAVIIAGDIYDKAVPSAEAVSLFDSFISSLTETLPDAEIMMISGNHDSAPRVNVYRSILSRQRIHMIGIPPQAPGEHIEKVTLSDEYGDVDFWLLPFVKPSMVRRAVGTEEDTALSYDEAVRRLLARDMPDPERRSVLVSHQFYLPDGSDPDSIGRTDSEIKTAGNIDSISADVLEPYDYAALGHIHKPMTVGKHRFRYCGTPLAYSVSEAGQQKGIIMAELGEKRTEVSLTVIPLEPLHQVREITGSLEEILSQACDDYVRAVLVGRPGADAFDIQDRLRCAFPNLLEIRREWQGIRGTALSGSSPAPDTDPFTICCQMLGDLDEAEEALLREVVNAVKEEEE
ncbi:MAG: exonuclease SbcCD subunit D [Ruminococcus sp.]|nr:exonuclease SbcCD subunit D [Ruminococcus sp.]